jgi:hypothetical protein
MCTDVKDFYLNTPMAGFEYMRLPIHIIPPQIVDQYKLLRLVQDSWVYVEIRKGMYGLPQAGIIASQRLEKHLPNMAINLPIQPLDCGATNPAPSPSPLSLTTLASNTLAKNTHGI